MPDTNSRGQLILPKVSSQCQLILEFVEIYARFHSVFPFKSGEAVALMMFILSRTQSLFGVSLPITSTECKLALTLTSM